MPVQDFNTVIRRASPADAPALRAILRDTFQSTWLPNISPTAAQDFRDEDRPAAYIAQRGHVFWVAERDGAVIGFVDWQGDFVNALHVHSRFARSGAGTRLMDTAEVEIGAAGHVTSRLETDTFNTTSQAFYAKRGYREVDRYPDAEWNSDLTTILLVKSLA